jgi:hypothetical protein
VLIVGVGMLGVWSLGACSNDEQRDPDDTTAGAAAGVTADAAVGMSIASFDNAADLPSPVMVGISSIDGDVVAGGSVDLTITPTGTGDTAPMWAGVASFLPVPGRPGDETPSRPRWGPPSAGVGVYRTEPLRLLPGFYEVVATAMTDRGPLRVATGLEVLVGSRVLAPGDQAPRTRNAVIGSTGVPPGEIDSRAATPSDLDPRIHSVVIADALAAGRPALVAVTTPVYCQSKFCGPITDVVAGLAEEFPAVAAVHLEVWKDFDAKVVSPVAAEWIWPDGDAARGANEPWVFLVGPDGTITHRWGNVIDLEELRGLLAALG